VFPQWSTYYSAILPTTTLFKAKSQGLERSMQQHSTMSIAIDVRAYDHLLQAAEELELGPAVVWKAPHEIQSPFEPPGL
jgi:hypothetical protein